MLKQTRSLNEVLLPEVNEVIMNDWAELSITFDYLLFDYRPCFRTRFWVINRWNLQYQLCNKTMWILVAGSPRLRLQSSSLEWWSVTNGTSHEAPHHFPKVILILPKCMHTFPRMSLFVKQSMSLQSSAISAVLQTHTKQFSACNMWSQNRKQGRLPIIVPFKICTGRLRSRYIAVEYFAKHRIEEHRMISLPEIFVDVCFRCLRLHCRFWSYRRPPMLSGFHRVYRILLWRLRCRP